MGGKTDLEKFVELYGGVGIVLSPEKIAGIRDNMDDSQIHVTLEVDNLSAQSRVKGYAGYYTRLVFDKEGKFLEQGIWE
jgi:hypothetical protein